MAVYRISEKAEAKLREIYEYSLLNFGEHQADAYYMGLHETFVRLAEMPMMGRVFRIYRRHDHGQHAILYKMTENDIVIAQIFHHSENIDGRLV